MPFEILTATEEGAPLVTLEWPGYEGVWPGHPGRWKAARPGLLNFLQTMRVPIEISCLRHGSFANGVLQPGWSLPTPPVLCCNVAISFPRHDRVHAEGYVALPLNHATLLRPLEHVFIENNFGEEWGADEELLDATNRILRRYIPTLRPCPVLAPYGFPSGQTLLGLFESIEQLSPSVPDLMCRVARAAEHFEHEAAGNLVAGLLRDVPEIVRDITSWAVENRPED